MESPNKMLEIPEIDYMGMRITLKQFGIIVVEKRTVLQAFFSLVFVCCTLRNLIVHNFFLLVLYGTFSDPETEVKSVVKLYMLLLFYLSIGSPEHNGKNVISYVKIILVFQCFDF